METPDRAYLGSGGGAGPSPSTAETAICNDRYGYGTDHCDGIQPPTSPSTTRSVWPSCSTASGGSASEQAAALAGRAAAHAALDDPGHAVRLLDSLWAVSAHEQAAALARDRAVHIPLYNQLGMADLLASLRGGRQTDRRPARRAAAE